MGRWALLSSMDGPLRAQVGPQMQGTFPKDMGPIMSPWLHLDIPGPCCSCQPLLHLLVRGTLPIHPNRTGLIFL